jgi:hypothetical protein
MGPRCASTIPSVKWHARDPVPFAHDPLDGSRLWFHNELLDRYADFNVRLRCIWCGAINHQAHTCARRPTRINPATPEEMHLATLIRREARDELLVRNSIRAMLLGRGFTPRQLANFIRVSPIAKAMGIRQGRLPSGQQDRAQIDAIEDNDIDRDMLDRANYTWNNATSASALERANSACRNHHRQTAHHKKMQEPPFPILPSVQLRPNTPVPSVQPKIRFFVPARNIEPNNTGSPAEPEAQNVNVDPSPVNQVNASDGTNYPDSDDSSSSGIRSIASGTPDLPDIDLVIMNSVISIFLCTLAIYFVCYSGCYLTVRKIFKLDF